MVLFGEIVEPTTRALWDEDVMEYPSNFRTQLQWKNEAITAPDKIETLIIVETKELIQIVEHCLPLNKIALNRLNEVELEIYDLDPNTYIILCRSSKNRTYAEITEALECWLKSSDIVICLTSKPTTLYQADSQINEKTSFVKHLTGKPITNIINSRVLESPNLITGLGAGILTYGITKGLSCISFVIYLEMAQLDSINTKQVLDLLKFYYKGPIKPYKLSVKMPENNIYM